MRATRTSPRVEVTPQHLTFAAPEIYEELGTLAQMNPPLRDARHQERLWWGLDQGVVDVLGSDHAPHTLDEKAKSYPATPSGMPGVQTLVPVMLDHVNSGRLSLARFVDLTSAGPQRIFGIAGKGRIALGYDADLTVVDLKAERVIENDVGRQQIGVDAFRRAESQRLAARHGRAREDRHVGGRAQEGRGRARPLRRGAPARISAHLLQEILPDPRRRDAQPVIAVFARLLHGERELLAGRCDRARPPAPASASARSVSAK